MLLQVLTQAELQLLVECEMHTCQVAGFNMGFNTLHYACASHRVGECCVQDVYALALHCFAAELRVGIGRTATWQLLAVMLLC